MNRAADQKYKGETVVVSGKITASGTDLTGKVFALSEVGGAANYVRCEFPEQAKAEVAENQMATLRGTVAGDVYGDVKISDCTMAK